jgi:hypothetical protein
MRTACVADVPRDAVLGGFSMGVGVIGERWPERTDAAAVFCLHAPTRVPDGVRTRVSTSSTNTHVSKSLGPAPGNRP